MSEIPSLKFTLHVRVKPKQIRDHVLGYGLRELKALLYASLASEGEHLHKNPVVSYPLHWPW